MYYYFLQWVILSFSVCPVVHIRAYESYERDRQFRITRQTKGFLFSLSYRALSLLRLSSPYRMTLSLIPVCVCVCGYVYTYTEHFFYYYYYSLFYSLIYYLNWIVLYNFPETQGRAQSAASTSGPVFWLRSLEQWTMEPDRSISSRSVRSIGRESPRVVCLFLLG